MSYNAPAPALADIKNTPYPNVWGDPALETLFTAQTSGSGDRNTTHGNNEPTVKEHRLPTTTIVGAAVGGLAAVTVFCVGGWLYQRSRKGREANAADRSEVDQRNRQKWEAQSVSYHELEVKPEEMEANQTHHEMVGDLVWPKRSTRLYELPARNSPRCVQDIFP